MKKRGSKQKQGKEKYRKPKVLFCKKLTAIAGICSSGYVPFAVCKTSGSCGACARS